MLKSDSIALATQYSKVKGIEVIFDSELGGGQDGWVWETKRPSAIKTLERKSNFNTELHCYQRLGRAEVRSIRGFSVPQLIDFSKDLQIIEMTIVRKPFLLDFAKSYLDSEPDFSNEHWEEWERSGIELFGEARWKEPRIVVASLKSHGIYYYDVRPWNLMFSD
jgi:hypothetical protein